MNNNEQKPDSFAGGGDNSQFNQSGFGNSTFGGDGASGFNGQGNSTFGAAGNSKFGGGAPNSEFGASGFGGNSSVSQIFKEGGFGDDEKRKRTIVIAAGVAAVLVVLGAVYFLFLGDSGDEGFQVGGADQALPVDDFAAPAEDAIGGDAAPVDDAFGDLGGDDALLSAEEEAALLDEPALPQVEESLADTSLDAGAAGIGGAVTGNVTTWDYNEELGGPTLSVNPGAMIEVSRRADFANTYVYGPATDGNFRIPNPPPGVVYWREQGSQTVNEIQVNPPPALGVSFSAPANLTAGETLSWSSAGAAAYYRVEFSTDPSFQNIAAAVSTTGTQAVIDGLGAGTYYVRVGGLNTAAGRFEYSQGSSVTIQ